MDDKRDSPTEVCVEGSKEMRNMTTEHEYEVQLIDDGTLDTVVSVEGTQYRYTWDPSADEETTYEDFVEWALKDAVEMYEMDLETIAEFYREKAVSA